MTKEDKHPSHYMQSDGNGGYVISKKTLYLICFMLTLISFLVGFVAQVVAFNERISTIETNTKQNADANAVVHPIIIQHEKEIAVIESQMHAQEQRLARIELKIDKILESS